MESKYNHGYAFIDATGSLFREVKPYKRHLYYAITVRHPFPGKSPLPAAEHITSDHSKDSLIFFISPVNKYVQSMPSHSSPIFPNIIVLDFSLATVGAMLGSFNKTTLLDYLDKCYKILKEEREEYLNTVPVICSGHLVRAIKRFTENAVPCCKNKTLKNFCMKIMGRMIMTKQFEVLDRLGRSTLAVLTTKYISKDYLNHLPIAEKVIHNFNFEPLDEKLTYEDEIDFHKPDIQDNKNTVEEKLVQQSNFFKYWNVAGRNEKSDTSVNKDDENVTASQFYLPEFANKLRN